MVTNANSEESSYEGRSTQRLWLPRGENYGRDQSTWLTQSCEAISSVDNVPVTLWYSFRDEGTDPYGPESTYGLIETYWEIKPANAVYRNYISNAR